MIRHVPILLYHSIADEAVPQFRRWVVRPRTFVAQMTYLHDRGYTPLTVTQFAQVIANRGSDLPERPVVITFDDGLADFYTHALPVLTDRGFAATLYVVAGFVGGSSRWLSSSGEGTRPMLTWGQLGEIAAGGVECGAHSLRHPQIDILSPAAAQDEIGRSKWVLEQGIGREVATFAYPHGYYTAAVRRAVQAAGYSSACAVKHAMSDTTDDRFALSRLIVTDTADAGERAGMDHFALLLNGRGLRTAPARERVRTRVWRVARRASSVVERILHPETRLSARMEETVTATHPPPVAPGSAFPPLWKWAADTGDASPDVPAAVPMQAGFGGDTLLEVPQTGPLLVHDLLNTLEPLGQLLLGELRHGSWLNAYLLAAGMNQIVEDSLHPDPHFLGKAASYLARMPHPAGMVASGIARSLAAALVSLRCLHPQTRALMRRQAGLAALVQRLAAATTVSAVDQATRAELAEAGEALVVSLARWPARLRHEVLRLPACFRSFDQQPADLARLVHDFAWRWPDRGRPLVVVGIRTSGSYLAPLCAAHLTIHGYENVQTLSMRPERRLLKHERILLRAAIQRGGLVLLTDDPPSTGRSIARVAEELERAGIPPRSLILLLQLFEAQATLPPALGRYAAVLLPWVEWAVQAQLNPHAVRTTLSNLVAPAGRVICVERLAPPPHPSGRGHVQALYRVQLADRAGEHQQEQQILVEGTGLGYFGEHALAIVPALGGFLPHVYGVHAGLLYRDFLPEENRVLSIATASGRRLVTAMVQYIVARHRALPVREDMSLRLIGRLPVWEVASNLLSRAFGRGWLLVRIPVVDPVVHHLLRCRYPSVVDGSMALSHWFTDESDGGRIVKVDFEEHAFSHRDLACYDPAFDLASLAANVDLADAGWKSPGTALQRHLREAYELSAGKRTSEERWLLYQLVHLWDQQRVVRGAWTGVRRAQARALQRYFTAIMFKDVSVPETGDICALDSDGVLETSPLGFPSLTFTSALTLRALILHGYQPVLVTGRSLDEVRERCAAYHLAGGVAEYGAAVYNHRTGLARQLLSVSERQALAQLRAVLAAMPGICVDPDYRHCVRAYQVDTAGHRRALSPAIATLALAESATEQPIRLISGEGQTDFMVAEVNKSTGLRVLAADLGVSLREPDGEALALAVGDTVSDLPLFALASNSFAPANADHAVRSAGVTLLKRPYQLGVAQAATHLLGHVPGRCPVCRQPQISPETHLLLMILSAQEGGTVGIVWQTCRLALRVWSWKLRGHYREDGW